MSVSISSERCMTPTASNWSTGAGLPVMSAGLKNAFRSDTASHIAQPVSTSFNSGETILCPKRYVA